MLHKHQPIIGGSSSRLTQSFHFFMFEPIFSPVNALNQPI
ncbi:MAG TPA: sugar kinase [Shigella sp.]|nr:sugar kinase [Shigella sp.]